jgi:hypothetical protein
MRKRACMAAITICLKKRYLAFRQSLPVAANEIKEAFQVAILSTKHQPPEYPFFFPMDPAAGINRGQLKWRGPVAYIDVSVAVNPFTQARRQTILVAAVLRE